jgi:hypothetical protein
VMGAVVIVLTSASASGLTAATSSHMEDYARAATARLSGWVQLVQTQLTDYSPPSTAAKPR